MSLFGKKEKKEEAPILAELPKLPPLPEFDSPRFPEMPKNQLPVFPSNSFGKKFSQDSIKEAVTGKKDGEETFYADDFSNTERMMQESLRHPLAEEIEEDFGDEEMPMKKLNKKSMMYQRNTMEAEPIFIRIDKFEEGLKIINEMKNKVSEIENTLEEIRRIREREEKELQLWHENLSLMKSRMEKVDRDIFSKI